ncbi:MAG TPA: ABC transporter substrate-binding protein [Actinomycetota bacterium]|nr:ABC transporter substrate-binding protein [Actinomycetota bacterium]
MQRLPVAVASLVLATLVSSCESSAPPADRPTPSPSSTIHDGGRVVIGVLGEPATLDPYSPVASDLTTALAEPVYPSLFHFAGSGRVVPDLAADLTVDGHHATITLRPAEWDDGTPITASDVVRSARRAGPRSGFGRLRAVRRVGRRRIEATADLGSRRRWERTLASGSLVVSRDASTHPLRTSGGPFRVAHVTPGLEVRYVRDPGWTGAPPHLTTLVVRFVDSEDIMLELLKRGRLDAAVVPSTVNLPDRVDASRFTIGRQHGSERIYLDFDGSRDDPSLRERVVGAIETKVLQQTFVRDAGVTVFRGNVAGNRSGGGSIQLAAPTGDELLGLLQRALQLQLSRAGFGVDLVTVDARTFYGPWERRDPMDVALRREVGPPITGATKVALFDVDSFVVADRRVHGVVPTGQSGGPFADVASWWRE